MPNKHLYLFGSGPPFTTKLGGKFAEHAGSEIGKAAVLFIERNVWEDYMINYTGILREHGVQEFEYLPLSMHAEEIAAKLSECTAIIIGGGDTERYRDYIVDTVIGTRIRELYLNGIPVAGFSAGALISPAHCVIPPVDNRSGKHLFLKGLSLIRDCVISTHYSKWEEEENLRTAIRQTGVSAGFGIDDGTGMYFKNELVEQTEGESVYFFYAKQAVNE